MRRLQAALDKPGTSSVVQLVVAIVGALAVLGAALLANWDKVVSRKMPESALPAASRRGAAGTAIPSLQVYNGGPQGQIVAGVHGNVTVNVGTGRADGETATSPVGGHWESRDGDYLSAFDLNVIGTTVSGTALFRGEESSLHDGGVSGDTLEFTTYGTSPDGEDETRRYRGVLDGGVIRFTLEIHASRSGHYVLQFSATR